MARYMRSQPRIDTDQMRRSDIEIMAPVGSWESLYAAMDGGADSVYFGVEGLNMRSRSSANFTLADLERIAFTTRARGVKSYLTVNTILYDEDIPVMRKIIDCAREARIDAVIACDQSTILYAREQGVEVHISTQLNVSNTEAVRFFAQWADVVVLARELNLQQIKTIYDNIERENICGPSGQPVKIEMFAHGALCMAISGKCYLSLHENGCSANRGACLQLCRRSYELRDRDNGEQIAIEGQYLLSPKDLCTVGLLDRFLEAGVRVLKIEGRARPAEYVKRVCEVYNEAVTAVVDGNYTPERISVWESRLNEVFNRGFWGGYYLGSPVPELSPMYGSAAAKRKEYVGKVTNFFHRHSVAEITPEASTLLQGDTYIITGETTGLVEGCATEIRVDDSPVETAAKGTPFSIVTPGLVRRGDKLYKIVDSGK